jgi:hypothetical protein
MLTALRLAREVEQARLLADAMPSAQAVNDDQPKRPDAPAAADYDENVMRLAPARAANKD